MSLFQVPAGMTRRHFMTHLAGASAMAVPAMSFTNTLSRQFERHEEAAQVGHHAVDGRRTSHDRHLGSQARRSDRWRVQADRDLGRRCANLRAHAVDGQGNEAHVASSAR